MSVGPGNRKMRPTSPGLSTTSAPPRSAASARTRRTRRNTHEHAAAELELDSLCPDRPDPPGPRSRLPPAPRLSPAGRLDAAPASFVPGLRARSCSASRTATTAKGRAPPRTHERSRRCAPAPRPGPASAFRSSYCPCRPASPTASGGATEPDRMARTDTIDLHASERCQPFLAADLLEAMALAAVLHHGAVLLARRNQINEGAPPDGREGCLQVLDHPGEARGRRRLRDGRFDQSDQFFSELGDNTGDDLTYTPDEAPSFLDTSCFVKRTCVHYAGASSVLSARPQTTSGQTYTRNLDNTHYQLFLHGP